MILKRTGIKSIEQIETPTVSDAENIVRITLTDGCHTDISIRNGSKGEPGAAGGRGPAGIESVIATVDNPGGDPSVDTELVDGELTLAFHNLGSGGGGGTPSGDYVPTSRTINGYPLSSNINLTLDDIPDGINRQLGGGGGGYVLTREAITNLIADNRTITGLYAERASCDGDGNNIALTYLKKEDNFFEVVSVDNHDTVKLKDAYVGLWANGWVASGGIAASGGGGGGSYVLPVATANTLGGIKVGSGLSIDANGVLSATGGGGTGVYSIKVGTTTYTPTDGVVSLPNYVRTNQLAASITELIDVTPILTSGTPIATIQYGNASAVTLYAPSGGGGGTGTEEDPVFTASPAHTISTSDISRWNNKLSSHQTVTLASGTNNGTLKITTAAGTTDNIAVTGLGALAFKDNISVADITDIAQKYVTIGTTQTITGAKTFTTNPVTIGSTSGIKVNGSSYVDIGGARLVYDSNAKALHVTTNAGETIGFYADGFVASGGMASSRVTFVSLDQAQSITGQKTFGPQQIFTSGIAIGSASTRVSIATSSSSLIGFSANASFVVKDANNATVSANIQDMYRRIVALESA